jgi:alkylated DNA repair dioxygenase AlkB
VGAFLNLYRDGNEYAPYHADKYGCDCGLLSLGTMRILRYKKNDDTKDQIDYELNNGDLLFIPDDVNENYKHSLLKRTKVKEPRISILFFFSESSSA